MPPRTASTWTCKAIQNSGIKAKHFGPKHATALPPNAPMFRFTFIREPNEWIRSRWTLGKWEDELSELWDIDLEKFRAVVSPAMVKMYFGKFTQGATFVGKTENIADDLVAALTQAGEEFDEEALRATPRINASPEHGDLIGSAYWAMTKKELGNLPPGMISRLPIELYQRLPSGTLENLPPDILAATVKRITTHALQSAGAGGGRR